MVEKKKPEWVKMSLEELEKLVVEIHKTGESPAKIGIILRDKHGVPKSKLIGKRITKILKDHKLKIPTEKELIEKKISVLNSHISKNKHDYSAQRSLTKKLWITKKAK